MCNAEYLKKRYTKRYTKLLLAGAKKVLAPVFWWFLTFFSSLLRNFPDHLEKRSAVAREISERSLMLVFSLCLSKWE